MATTSSREEHNSSPRIGDCSAAQPLSGVLSVEASFAVNGLGHGGFVRVEKSEKKASSAA